MGLIPTELHSYSLKDVLRGVASVRRRTGRPASIALPGVGEATSIRSARAAVIVTLKALGLPAGSRIGVPLYCCPVVFKAVKAAGCRPKFIDIDPGTHCLSTADLIAKQAGLDAVIAVHMFGNLCDMPGIMAIMAGRPVVEDCAQSLGSRLDGRACGSFGDAAFFSFRSGKYLAVGEGAAVFSRDRTIQARALRPDRSFAGPYGRRGGQARERDLPPVEAPRPALVGTAGLEDLGPLQQEDGIRRQIADRRQPDVPLRPGHSP